MGAVGVGAHFLGPTYVFTLNAFTADTQQSSYHIYSTFGEKNSDISC